MTNRLTTLHITGMSCGSCVRHIDQTLCSVVGVHRVTINREAACAQIHHEPTVTMAALIAAIVDAGYAAKESTHVDHETGDSRSDGDLLMMSPTLGRMDDTSSHRHVERLAADIERFRAFVRGRVKDVHVAEDVLQDAFARAARAIDQLEDGSRLDAWFYRILRNRIADVGNDRNHHELLVDDPMALNSDEQQVCQCFQHLIERLPQENAEALRRVDLGGLTSEAVAAELGITVNALNVRRHRGRQQLRTLLTTACGMCARDGCHDCRCT